MYCRIMSDVYWMKLYMHMMSNKEKFVTSPALHSLISSTIEPTFVYFEVKGAEIEAYAWDKERPMSACFNAPQSLAPSPHIDTFLSKLW